MEDDDFRKLKNPFDDSTESEPTEAHEFLSDTFVALLDEEITDDRTSPSASSASSNSNDAKPARPTTPAPTLDPRAPARPTKEAPSKTPEQIKKLEELTILNIGNAREKYERAFPETFSTTIVGNAAKLKVLNGWLQKEIEACNKKQTAISADRANDIYILFLLSDIISTSTPFQIELDKAQLEKIKLFVRKQITDLRVDFGGAAVKPPQDIDAEQWRKSRTSELNRTVSELVRALPEVRARCRAETRKAVETELSGSLKFTDLDLGTGFMRNPGSVHAKKIIAEIKWHLQPQANELAKFIVKSFHDNMAKVDKTKAPESMATILASKNGKLFELLAKTFKESTKILVKQKLPTHVKGIVKDIFLFIDNAAKGNIKDTKQRAAYALQLKKQVLPFVLLNGYGGTITSMFLNELTGNQQSCANYIWKLLVSEINSVGAIKKDGGKSKDMPQSVVDVAKSSSKEIVGAFEAMFKDIENNDPNASV